MGSLRGGVIALLATATPAAAGICDRLRPDWSVADGPVTALDEALALLIAPWPLLTIAVTVAAYVFRKPVLNHIALALAISLTTVLVVLPFVAFDASLVDARAEGCVGPSELRYGLAGLILLGTIAVMVRNWRLGRRPLVHKEEE